MLTWVRCTSTGRKCDGYAPNTSAQFKAFELQHTSIFQYTAVTPSVSSDAIQYLEFYHHCVRHALSSRFDTGFWSRIVLQMAHSEPSIRHALIVLGYLNKTETGSLKHARSGVGHCNQTFFFHYNRAITSLVDRMAEVSYSSEVGLVTCVLFICIEFLRGEYRTAFMHLENGLHIIAEWKQYRVRGGMADRSAAQSFPVASRYGTGPNALITDQLIPIFARTMTPALLYGAPVEQVLKVPIPDPQSYRAQAVASILDLQASNLELRNATIIFLRIMAYKLFLREPITSADAQTQTQLLDCHHAWSQALETLEHESHLSLDDKIIASSLKVGYYSTYISLACAMEITQTPYDAHIAKFKALNHHTKIVLDSMPLFQIPSPSIPAQNGNRPSAFHPHTRPSPTANFTFEISLIPALQFAATRCRCPTTRREAAAMLERGLPREGLWDAEQQAVVARRVIEIEERVVDEKGWPVEGTRLWSAVIDGDMDRNGGFWVSFAEADWARGEGRGVMDGGKRRRPDAQWEEWFV